MRFLLGIILGAFLTVGGAYLHDSRSGPAADAPATARPMVNWDVVNATWDHLTNRARAEWHKLRAGTRET